MTIKYELIIYWSDQDQSFIVEVPELAGGMADGETYEHAVMNAKLVIEEWAETARQLGCPIPEPEVRLTAKSVFQDRASSSGAVARRRSPPNQSRVDDNYSGRARPSSPTNSS